MWPCRQVAGVQTTFAENRKQSFNIRASYICIVFSSATIGLNFG